MKEEIIDAEVVEEKSTAMVAQPVSPMMLEPLRPVMDLATAKERLKQFQEFVQFYLKEGEDFGTITGTPKPTLYKPGADKLCELYGLSDDYVALSKTVDWEAGLFDYEFKCVLYRGDRIVSTGIGCCSSYESKYRWRDTSRTCPNCGKGPIIKGKDEYGGGWLCWGKKGGCGAKFKDGDQAIEGQKVEKVQNPDIADVKNTIIKMAKKRAKVDATLAATRSSGIFTQDMEDIRHVEPDPDGVHVEFSPAKAAPAAPSNGNGKSSGTVISEADRQAIYKLAGKKGVTHNALTSYLKATYDIDSPTRIPSSAFADVCLWIKEVAA